MKEYDKFTNISNSVDIRGVCWFFGWRYFNDQSANITRKKADNLKFEICFIEHQNVHMGQQTLKISLKMLMFTCKNHKVVCGDDRKEFDPLRKVNLECDLSTEAGDLNALAPWKAHN